MLLKLITLTDFRQFKGKQTVVFSDSHERNVTVIMGENGAGKTTFAQAFRWCLYGVTDFADPNVMSKSKINEMMIGEEATASVEIVLIHTNVTYTIIRSQKYKVDKPGSAKGGQTRLQIIYKGADGQQEFVPESQTIGKIKEILPQELSSYFFFDGERINNMSKEIQKGQGKSSFGDAVRKLLGLDTYKAAMKHLKDGTGGNNVISQYNQSYSGSSDETIKRLSDENARFQQELERHQARIAELEEELPSIQYEIEQLSGFIERNRDGERLKSEIKRLQSHISTNQALIKGSTTSILRSFKQNYHHYFASKLMADALELLAQTKQIDKGVPDIHARTIEFLLNRGVCICGNQICDGSSEFMMLQKLKEYIPPQSLGTLVRNFAIECKTYSGNVVNLYEMIQNAMQELTNKQTENADYQAQIDQLEEDIKKFSDIGDYQRKIEMYRGDYRKKQQELFGLKEKVGSLQTKIERNETTIREHSLKSENNRQIELYKAYALRLYEVLKDDYTAQETEIRKQLEESINEIYSAIYNGEVTLQIDQGYNITTQTKGFANVETGTAQGISIIFAFIAGVIKMARKNDKHDYLATEPYPLVMDAPLSAFDKSRIQSVCQTLPNIAEQVIIFIKDTDGEIAQEHLEAKIGKQFKFNKLNELETIIEE